MNVVPLTEADDSFIFGGKASQLCCALQKGLPVPDGFALSFSTVHDVSLGKLSLEKDLDIVLNKLGVAAVRSSAVGEDGELVSFAGQYTSCLNINTVAGIEEAICSIWKSAFSDRVLAYRKRMGLPHQAPKVGVIVQKMIHSDVSGIMFTRNPVSRVDERVIEAAWGLGDVIASGSITPEYYRMGRDGEIREKEAGNVCLSDHQLKQLNELANQCEGVFGHELDMEWTFYQGNLFLLQCRHITV